MDIKARARDLHKYIHIQNFSRFALFVVYFWFGALKVASLSPATELVRALHDALIPFIDLHLFFVMFGVLEMIIGLLFLIPAWTRYAKLAFALHIGSTILPLVLLPAMTWSGLLVPTLEGQYIIKNIVLIALVLNLRSESAQV